MIFNNNNFDFMVINKKFGPFQGKTEIVILKHKSNIVYSKD